MGDQKKPWEIGKSFDHAAPIGPIHPVAQTGHYREGDIWLAVNGERKQQATLSHMIWSVEMCIRDRSYPIATLITSYVDGAYLAPRAGSHHLPVINPATESVIAQLQEADGAEVDLAVRAAARSYAEGTWRRLPTERLSLIHI